MKTITRDTIETAMVEAMRLAAPEFHPGRIATIYGVAAEDVRILPFARVRTIKVSMPRPDGGSGGPADRDVYGCQQHFPLADLEIG